MDNKKLVEKIRDLNKSLHMLYAETFDLYNECYELNQNSNIRIEVNPETNESTRYELYNDDEYVDSLKTLEEALMEGLLENDHNVLRRSLRKKN